MRTRNSVLVFLASLFVFWLSAHQQVMAQSTIMNTPSTGVVAANKVYLEMDFLTNYAWQREGSFQNYIPRAVVGVGRNVEVGVNVSYTHISDGESQPIEVQPNVKWQFYSNEGNGTAIAVGCILYAPITHRTGTNTLGQCYSVASKKLPGRFGPKFTGGPYFLINASEDQKTKVGATIGYEQPLSGKVSFIVDWSSGNNRFGYISPALYFVTSKNSGLSTGYTIANHGRGKNALFAYYGIQF
jgi:hypothetical protein